MKMSRRLTVDEKPTVSNMLLKMGTREEVEMVKGLSEIDERALYEGWYERRDALHVFQSKQLTDILSEYMRRKLLRTMDIL